MSGRGSAVKPPSEAFLRKVARELRSLPAGSQRAVGGGVYMRLDGDGTRRFIYRRSRIEPGGTCATWEEAHRRHSAVTERAVLLDGDVAALDRYQLRELTFAEYASKIFWPDWSPTVERLTASDYAGILRRDVIPLIGGRTLRELDELPVLIDRLQRDIRERKRFPAGHPRAGEVPGPACLNVLKVARAVCEHARLRGIISRNPIQNIRSFKPSGKRANAERRVRRNEIFHPRIVGAAMTGIRAKDPLQLWRRRMILLLILIGFRPEVIGAMRWKSQRTVRGARRHFLLTEAVKLVNGRPELGVPKTGVCEPFQFSSIARLFERLYELAGRPDLEELVFPNARGGLLDWNNFRDGVWYPALHRAGIAAAPKPRAKGAFHPYLLRHIGVTTMLHARRHDGDGNYTHPEVANQFTHTPGTLFRVYAKVVDDIHGVAGKTMDEIIVGLLRDAWGPMPGDLDYIEEWLTTTEAAELTGLSVNALGSRLKAGTLRGRRVVGRHEVTRFELEWMGLMPRMHGG